MKLKMLTILACSSLFASSLALAAPAIQPADDLTGSTNMTTPSTDTAASPQNTDMTNPGATPSSTGMPTTTNPSDTSNSNDDMSADTATGDDDY